MLSVCFPFPIIFFVGSKLPLFPTCCKRFFYTPASKDREHIVLPLFVHLSAQT